MHFDSYSIARKRYRMRRTLRFAAVVLVAIAVWLAAFWAVQMVVSVAAPAVGWIIGLPIAPTGAFVFTAVFLLIVERKFTTWIVPAAPKGCPNCGYSIDSPVS